MIFKTNIEDFHLFESYKERNLYYKIFARYLFNEVIPGYQERKARFLDLIRSLKNDNERFIDLNDLSNKVLSTLETEEWNITFDYHTAQIFKEDKRNDRGEMSDILLITKSSFVSFECKFLSKYTIEKDIYSVQERMQKFVKSFNRSALQILLLKKDKWDYSSKIRHRIMASEFPPILPIIVLFWEDLRTIITDKHVLSYLDAQIQRKLKIELL